MGRFEWTRTSQGLHSAPSQYQRLMKLTVKGLHNVIVYIDDLLVHNSDHVLHCQSLQSLFDQLRKANLKLNLTKCNFGSTNVTHLGFLLTPEGILPGSDKLAAVKNTTPPKNVHQIRQFWVWQIFFALTFATLLSSPPLLTFSLEKTLIGKGAPSPSLLSVLLTNFALLFVLNLWSITHARTALMPSLLMLPRAVRAARVVLVLCYVRATRGRCMSLLMLAALSPNTKKIILRF
jgi:hypothetical protein